MKSMKSVMKGVRIAAFAIFALALLRMPMTALAYTGTVTATTANVRSQPSASSEAIASVTSGNTIDIRSKT
ncbi:MAG: SH3 domain-containing protein, partial [Lachnospiraceae bacterium]|nr:SH3 domain-containing protein [Lachnospiraceae bacterium]